VNAACTKVSGVAKCRLSAASLDLKDSKHHAALGAQHHDNTKDNKCIRISSRVSRSERQHISLSQGRRVLLSAKQFSATPRAPTRLCHIPRKSTCADALRSEASFPVYQTAKGV
jgi:hypothetical protein